jgi:superoxide dismutase
MELHHKNHHQTYVNSFNAASEQLASAEQKEDIPTQIALQPLINFHGGGHINHSLFWENLAPSKNGGGGEPTGQLKVSSLSHTQLSMSLYIEQLLTCYMTDRYRNQLRRFLFLQD